VAEDSGLAFRRAAPFVQEKYRTYASWGQASTLPEDDSWSENFAELTRDRFVIGDPEEVVDTLSSYRDGMGVTDLSLRLCWPGMPQADVLAAIELLGRHVIPRLAA
jgi:alkanesulfonate monooxygenase SsuD/methylene tetrahydromethanopterin reductase-like flavin-dependent oxidoreductase (luciferase family)